MGSNTRATNMGWRLWMSPPCRSLAILPVLGLKAKSAQRKCRSAEGLLPGMRGDQIRAKSLIEKAHPSTADAKTTFPFSGEKVHSASRSSRAFSRESLWLAGPFPLSSSCVFAASSVFAARFATKAAARAFTRSTVRRSRCQVSCGSSCSSEASRSILLRTRHGFIRSAHAWRRTAWVWTQTPSTTSTTTSAPSHKRVAVDTSLQKSMCPGESIRLTK
mmetsp:Transcript_12420/g.29217  ORF Transcript_12420/g.29217 Transcript_12420/m.29217 type:complete len:218 (+) Transcript_12420:562-1215(+)